METSSRTPDRRTATLPLLGLLLGLGLSSASLATPLQLKPGLWESHMEGSTPGMPAGVDTAKAQEAMKKMQAQMAQMSPEQRRMMEKYMGGMQDRFSSDGGIRICISPEDLKQEKLPLEQRSNQMDCKTDIVSRSSQRWVVKTQCSNPPMNSETEAIFESPTSYVVKSKGQMTRQGKSQPFAMTMRMKYLSPDCGGVKSASELRAQYQQGQQPYLPKKPQH